MKPSQKSAPDLLASQNSAERDPSVTPDWAGADTPSSVSTPAQDATALADRLELHARAAAIASYDTAAIDMRAAAIALRATSQTPDAVREAVSTGIMSVVSSRDDLGYTHFIEIRDAVFKELSTPSASAGPQADAVAKWVSPIKTIADLVNNLLTLDQSAAVFGAYHIDNALTEDRCRARGLSISWEHVANERIKQDESIPYSLVIWTADERHPQPQQADGRGATEINIEGIIGDCVSIDALPWKNDDGSPTLLNRIIGIHEAANQIRAALQQSDGPAK